MATYGIEEGVIKSSTLTLRIHHPLEFNNWMLGLKADLGFMSTEAYAKAYEAGLPLKIVSVAVIQGNERGNALLFVRASSDIESPSQLAGRKIGLPSPRGLKSSNLILMEILKRNFNLTLSLDSPLIVDKPVPQLPALLDSGEVDAVLAIGDVAARMYLEPQRYRLIYDVSWAFKEIYGKYPIVAVVVVREDLLRSDPEAVAEALRLLNESLLYGQQHLDEALRWALKRRGEAESPQALEVAFECFRQYEVRYGLSEVDKEIIMEVFRLAYVNGLISKIPDPNQVFVDLEL